jgi:hypothetical protein
MDPTRFDHLAIAVGQRSTRRTALGLLAGLGLTGLVREEADAVCVETGKKCTKAHAAFCCSGICKKRRCRCPQRQCCQCTTLGGPVSCSFVTTQSQCTSRCANQSSSGILVLPQPGTKSTTCTNNQCSQVNCAP